jgi:carboxylate-amine ligase
MVRTETLVDAGMMRPAVRALPTVEVRVADVCLRADDAVMIAVLARALMKSEARSAALAPAAR